MNKTQVKKFLKELDKLARIEVEWVDAEKDHGDGWLDMDEAIPKNQKYVTAITIGYFIGYSKELLRCTSDYDKSNNKIYGTNDIQLSNVKEIRLLEPTKLSSSNVLPQ
jgi:hypothetical protein